MYQKNNTIGDATRALINYNRCQTPEHNSNIYEKVGLKVQQKVHYPDVVSSLLKVEK